MGTPRGLQPEGALAALVHFIVAAMSSAQIIYTAIRRLNVTVERVVSHLAAIHARVA
jgi:hypothetical protein